MTELETSRLIDNYHLLSYDEVDSTNDEARRLANGGAAHGAVIWAKQQTAGRGRMGREWVSEEGNLYVTVLLRPSAPLEALPQLSFVASLAVLESLTQIVENGEDLKLKWPNDILLAGRKIGGVLLESFEASGKQWVSVGVGINVEHYPDNVMFPATCLTEAGVQIVSAKIVLSRFIYHFIQLYDAWCDQGFAEVGKEWMYHAWRIGETVEIDASHTEYKGTFDGIDEQGRMLMTTADGTQETISAGDMLQEMADAAGH